MKITLVNPSAKKWIVSRSKVIPLGLAYIGACLEKAGHSVVIIDENIHGEAKIHNTDIVGITATTPLIESAWEIAERSKKSGAVTVIGGPHVTCMPEESARLSFVDYVVVGEGEFTMAELCTVLERGHNPEKIQGLCYELNGTLIHTQARPPIENLEDIPLPAYHLFPPLNQYTNPSPLLGTRSPSANIMTSRGCPFQCIYCFIGTLGRKWRARSPASVLEEWKYLIEELGVKEIAIHDDVFNLRIDRVIELCELITEQNLVIPWTATGGLRADLVTKEMLMKMKEAGCYRVAIGVEVGTQEMLDRIRKKLTLDQIRDAFRLSKEVGLRTVGLFMIGSNPDESRESMEETIQFAKELDPDYAQFSMTTPYPGTQLFDEVLREGRLLVERWSDYYHQHRSAFYECKEVTADLMEEMMGKAYREFYFRPRYMARLLTNTDTWRNLPNVLRAGFHLLKRKRVK